LRLEVLTLYDLAKGTLAKYVQDQVAILVSRFLRPQNVVHVEDIVAILIVISIVLDALAWLRQDSPRVPRRLVFEAGIANPVCRWEMGGESLQWLHVR
jgi:hypothetical protein